MRWYFPSWNGDLRVEAIDDKSCKLIALEPTPDEVRILGELGKQFTKRRLLGKPWVTPEAWSGILPTNGKGPYRTQERRELVLGAPLGKVSPVVLRAMKPGRQTLTAIVLKNGRIETVEGSATEATDAAGEKAEKEGKAAATVKRPTPSCPQCIPGSIGPATEVLLEFLTPEQHADWARRRTITVTGQLTGHRYLIAHRHTPIAQRMGRICMDLDDPHVLHFHDWSVPPEEEVLAAKLCLEHREPWLRNEATMLTSIGSEEFDGGMAPGVGDHNSIFKNPFGDGLDGVADAKFTRELGSFFLGFASTAGIPLPTGVAL